MGIFKNELINTNQKFLEFDEETWLKMHQEVLEGCIEVMKTNKIREACFKVTAKIFNNYFRTFNIHIIS